MKYYTYHWNFVAGLVCLFIAVAGSTPEYRGMNAVFAVLNFYSAWAMKTA